jgi:hypothetical protein
MMEGIKKARSNAVFTRLKILTSEAKAGVFLAFTADINVCSTPWNNHCREDKRLKALLHPVKVAILE